MNEYEILLSYLDKQNNSGLKSKKDETNKVKSFEDILPEEVKPTEISKTKKIIEECQEKNNLDAPQFSSNSVGFDAEKFESMMRARLIDDYKKLQSYERPYISVTELFSCLRKSYYNRLKYSTDLKKQFNFAYLDLINRIGNTIHDYVQEIYNFSEIEKTIVSNKYKTKGRADAINDTILYEFKSLEEKKFKNIYIKEHYYQALIYSYILNTEYNYNINLITLVYFFRDNLKRKPYTIDLPLDDKIAISFLEGAILLHDCISQKIIIDPINATSEQCRWCPYISYCEKDESKIKKPFEVSKRTNEKQIDFTEDDFKEKKKETIFLL